MTIWVVREQFWRDQIVYPEPFKGEEEKVSWYAEQFPKTIYFYADLVPPNTEILTHTEDTFFKVIHALGATNMTADQITACITEMQNRGILFRERVVSND